MAESDWFWEGNVVRAVCEHLTRSGWTIKKTADTALHEPGADILATRRAERLVVEVKGYPSKFYERGAKKGQPKPTNPATQARHWLAEALFTALLRQADAPGCRVAMAFPEFDVYTRLLGRLGPSVTTLGLTVFLVRSSGAVVTMSHRESATS